MLVVGQSSCCFINLFWPPRLAGEFPNIFSSEKRLSSHFVLAEWLVAALSILARMKFRFRLTMPRTIIALIEPSERRAVWLFSHKILLILAHKRTLDFRLPQQFCSTRRRSFYVLVQKIFAFLGRRFVILVYNQLAILAHMQYIWDKVLKCRIRIDLLIRIPQGLGSPMSTPDVRLITLEFG
jgi:hypothetical protein